MTTPIGRSPISVSRYTEIYMRHAEVSGRDVEIRCKEGSTDPKPWFLGFGETEYCERWNRASISVDTEENAVALARRALQLASTCSETARADELVNDFFDTYDELGGFSMQVRTNSHRRPIVQWWELSDGERKEFDYHDWAAVQRGDFDPAFVRYKDTLLDLGEFSADFGITKGAGLPDHLKGWDAYMSVHAFLAIVVKYVDEETVILGEVLS